MQSKSQIKKRIRELEMEQAKAEAAVEMAERLEAPNHIRAAPRDVAYRAKIIIATLKEVLQ